MFESFILLIFLLLLAYCMLLLFLAWAEPLWYMVLKGSKPDIKLSYEDFMKYYNLAPHRYQLGQMQTHLVRYEGHNFYDTWIGFNIIDTYKVVHTLKTVEKHQNIIKQQEQENEKMKKYLTHVQKDIDILLKKSDEQINEVKEIVNATQSYINDTPLVYDWKINRKEWEVNKIC